MRPRERVSTWTRWGVGVGFCGAVVFGPGAYELARLWLLHRRLDHRIAALSAQREQLAQEHDRLTSDPTYVEGMIRSTFKVASPGEIVVLLTTTAATASRERASAR